MKRSNEQEEKENGEGCIEAARRNEASAVHCCSPKKMKKIAYQIEEWLFSLSLPPPLYLYTCCCCGQAQAVAQLIRENGRKAKINLSPHFGEKGSGEEDMRMLC